MSLRVLSAFCAALLLIAFLSTQPIDVKADASSPIVERVFYLSPGLSPGTSNTTGALSLSRPLGKYSTIAGLNSSLEFLSTPPLQIGTVFIYTPMNMSLWLRADGNSTFSITGGLAEKTLTGGYFPVGNFTQRQPLRFGLHLYNFTITLQGQQILPYTQLSVGFKTTATPKANITIYYGSAATPSFVALPLSGYEGLAPTNPVVVYDHSNLPAQRFDLGSSFPNNTVFFQASIISGFGFSDISRVNMTVLDPNSHPVLAARNSEMRLTSQSYQTQQFVYTAFWIYPSNATSGTYQVHIDIIDSQNATAFRYRGPAGAFGLLSRTSPIVTATLNLIPYFGVGGVVMIGSVVIYGRRRRRKSYLVPFDHFNTLTGGELEGGTVVTVEGNTGSGKSLLSEQMMFEDLKKGRPCVFVATSDFPSNIRENMKSMGLNTAGYEQSGLLSFIDGYSSEAGQESKEKSSIPSLGDLTTMNMKITSSLPTESFKSGSLYFDSLTPLAAKTKPDSLISFVQSIGAKVRGLGGKAFFTMGPSVDGNVQKRLEDLADCVVQMEAFEERGARKSRLRIAKLRTRRFPQGWAIYTIEEGRGIIFYSKKPRQ